VARESSFCQADRSTPSSVRATTSRQVIGLEITLGEGPGNEACTRASRFTKTISSSASTIDGWRTRGRRGHRARSIFAFPIGIGAIRIGALILYRDRPGPLTERQESDAYLVASVIGRAILETRAGATELDLRGELGLAHSLISRCTKRRNGSGPRIVESGRRIGRATLSRVRFGVSMTTMAQSVVRRETSYDQNRVAGEEKKRGTLVLEVALCRLIDYKSSLTLISIVQLRAVMRMTRESLLIATLVELADIWSTSLM